MNFTVEAASFEIPTIVMTKPMMNQQARQPLTCNHKQSLRMDPEIASKRVDCLRTCRVARAAGGSASASPWIATDLYAAAAEVAVAHERLRVEARGIAGDLVRHVVGPGGFDNPGYRGRNAAKNDNLCDFVLSSLSADLSMRSCIL